MSIFNFSRERESSLLKLIGKFTSVIPLATGSVCLFRDIILLDFKFMASFPDFFFICHFEAPKSTEYNKIFWGSLKETKKECLSWWRSGI